MKGEEEGERERKKKERTIHLEFVFERVALKWRSSLPAHKHTLHLYKHWGGLRIHLTSLLQHYKKKRKKESYFLTNLRHWSSRVMLLLFTDSWRAPYWRERRRMWIIVMRDQQSSSPIELFISSTEMASTASTNVNGKDEEKSILQMSNQKIICNRRTPTRSWILSSVNVK